MKRTLFLLSAAMFGCTGGSGTTVTIENQTAAPTTVYVAFGADSVVTVSDWSFCQGSGLNCNFSLSKNGSLPLPTSSYDYLNATFSFDAAVGCGVTKAEVNVNNPKWYDTLDVSLVDGYSNKLQISASPTGGSSVVLGPPVGETGNEKVLGVFPYGCDICVARQAPPCGISTGTAGCKTGTQYDPTVPCQWQGTVKGGGGTVTVSLVD